MKIILCLISFFISICSFAQVIDITKDVNNAIDKKIDSLRNDMDSIIQVYAVTNGTTPTFVDIFQTPANSAGFYQLRIFSYNKVSRKTGLIAKEIVIENTTAYSITNDHTIYSSNGHASAKITATIVSSAGKPQLKLVGVAGQTINISIKYTPTIEEL